MKYRSHHKSAVALMTSAVMGATIIAAALCAARWMDHLSPHATLAPNMPFFQAPKISPPQPVPPAVS